MSNNIQHQNQESQAQNFCYVRIFMLRRRFAAALLPRLEQHPRSHHKGAIGRVQTGDQRYPVLCYCQLGQELYVLS